MASTAVEKTAEELRNEIEELKRQQWEISERLRDPRGLRRGGISGKNLAANGGRGRGAGFVRHTDRNDTEDQPPAKRRLSSAVVKVEDGEVIEDGEVKTVVLAADSASEPVTEAIMETDPESSRLQRNWSGRGNNQRPGRMEFDIPTEHVPRVMPKNEDPSLVNRNKRMLGQLLGTLEKFRKEDMKLSGTEAYMRRSTSLQKAEQRAREESERLRQLEREQLVEKRKRDLNLRARVAAKAEEKKLELLFLQWSEHHKKLGNFQRTMAEPPIYYAFSKPLKEDATLTEERKEQLFQEWKSARREELTEYQKQLEEQFLANVEKEQERRQIARKARGANNNNKNVQNLQETMDQELETHRLEHGPKKRKIPGGDTNETEIEDDIDDIAIGEDDMLDDVLGVDENSHRSDEAVVIPENGDTSLQHQQPDNEQQQQQ